MQSWEAWTDKKPLHQLTVASLVCTTVGCLALASGGALRFHKGCLIALGLIVIASGAAYAALKKAVKRGIALDRWSTAEMHLARQSLNKAMGKVSLVFLTVIVISAVVFLSGHRHLSAVNTWLPIYCFTAATDAIQKLLLSPSSERNLTLWRQEMKPVHSDHWGEL